MPFIEVKETKIEVNEEGFLANHEDWAKEVAELLAKEEEGIKNLTDDHWAVINYISCLLYTSPSPRDQRGSRMPSSA